MIVDEWETMNNSVFLGTLYIAWLWWQKICYVDITVSMQVAVLCHNITIASYFGRKFC